MNTLHPNLEFTLERPVDGKLPFLDTEVKQISNQLHTNVYRKATDTGLIMQYTSICPKSWKLGWINFYLNRALNICSNFTAFKDELTKIKNLLINNQYPKNLKESKINKFLDAHKIDNSIFKQNKSINTKNEKKTETENYSYFTTVYVGSWSIRFQKQIASIFQKHNINIKPAYTSKKVSDYFSNKSKCSEVFDANVIYKYTCSADQSISYIGETSRQIFRELQTTVATIKTAQYFNIFSIAKPVKTLT